MGPRPKRALAPAVLAAAALLAACAGGGAPSTATPEATIEVTPTIEGSAEPTRTEPAATPTAVSASFVIESRPSELQLVSADEAAGATAILYNVASGEMVAIDSDEFFRATLFEGGRHMLLDPTRAQLAPSLLVDIEQRTVVELVSVTAPGDVTWLNKTTVELSLPSQARPAQQLRHTLDVVTLVATPVEPSPFPTHDILPIRDGELHVLLGDSRPLISIRDRSGTEVSTIAGLLYRPVISPAGDHLAGVTGSSVLLASAPDWEPRSVALDFPFKETGSIAWSPSGESLLVAGSAGVFVIEPNTLGVRTVVKREAEGSYAAWSSPGDRILVHERGYGPLTIFDAATLEEVGSHEATSIIAEDPAGLDRLLAYDEACARDGEPFSLQMIDLVTGDATRLAPDEWGFWEAGWSPDGRWVAASRTRGRFTLIDTTTLTASVIGVGSGVPADLFPARFRWLEGGWVLVQDMLGRDRCFV